MRVFVVAPHSFHDSQKIWDTLDDFNITELCHSDRAPVDSMVAAYAQFHGIKTRIYDLDYTHNRSLIRTHLQRNNTVFEEFRPDLIISFQGDAMCNLVIDMAENYGFDVLKV